MTDIDFQVSVVKVQTCSADLSWTPVKSAQVYSVQQHHKYQGWKIVNWYHILLK